MEVRDSVPTALMKPIKKAGFNQAVKVKKPRQNNSVYEKIINSRYYNGSQQQHFIGLQGTKFRPHETYRFVPISVATSPPKSQGPSETLVSMHDEHRKKYSPRRKLSPDQGCNSPGNDLDHLIGSPSPERYADSSPRRFNLGKDNLDSQLMMHRKQ